MSKIDKKINTTTEKKNNFLEKSQSTNKNATEGNSLNRNRGDTLESRRPSFDKRKHLRTPQPMDNVLSVLLDRDFVITVKAGGKCRKVVLTFGVAIKGEKGIIRLGVARASGANFMEAKQAAISEAVKNAISVRVNKYGTIYHDFYSKFHGTRLYAYPARGGVIKAAPCISQLLSLVKLGITCKILSGSKNVLNIIKCLLKGLSSCETISDIARRCGITVEEVLKRRYATPLMDEKVKDFSSISAQDSEFDMRDEV